MWISLYCKLPQTPTIRDGVAFQTMFPLYRNSYILKHKWMHEFSLTLNLPGSSESWNGLLFSPCFSHSTGVYFVHALVILSICALRQMLTKPIVWNVCVFLYVSREIGIHFSCFWGIAYVHLLDLKYWMSPSLGKESR